MGLSTGRRDAGENLGQINQRTLNLSPLTPKGDEVTFKTEIWPEVACLHDSGVECITTTQDFRWLMTGDTQGIVRRYDVFAAFNNQTPLTQAQKQNGNLYETITRGGHLLGMFDAGDKSSTDDLLAPRRPVYSIALHPQAIWGVSGSTSGTIKLWSVRCEEGVNRATMAPPHAGPVVSLKLTDKATALVSGSWDKTVRHYDLNSCKAIHSFSGHTGPVTSVAVHPIDPVILSSSTDGSTRVWDRRLNSVVRILKSAPQNRCWVNSVVFSANGKECFAAKRDGVVDQWDLGTAKVVRRIKASPTPRSVTAVCAFPNGSTLATGTDDAVRIFDLNAAPSKDTLVSAQQTLFGHQGGDISAIMTDPDMKFLITSSGSRGWGSRTDRLVLMYRIGGIPS